MSGPGKKIALGAVADDYTGASDLANTLARNGLATIQTIGVPAEDLDLPPADAVVVALKSRSAPAADAVAWSRRADGWLRARGVRHVLFKVCSTFDSTDDGNIGPVTEALQDLHPGGRVLVTPAFPGTGRTVFQGHLFVGEQRLDESPLKDHPLNPMRDSSLVRTLARQSRRPVGLIPLKVVAEGPTAVGRHLASLAERGISVAIADAVFEADLETLGRAALEQPLSTGASGLGLGLARALAGEITAGRTQATAPVGGHQAVIAGSCSAATLGQIAEAERHMPVLRLDLERMLADAGGIAEAITWAASRLATGPVLVASSADPESVRTFQARHGGAMVGRRIEEALAVIATGLVDAGVRRLVVAGGETSGAIVDQLRIPAFLIGAEIAPGVPVVETIGSPGPRLRMALKSGNFGGPDFFEKALSMLT